MIKRGNQATSSWCPHEVITMLKLTKTQTWKQCIKLDIFVPYFDVCQDVKIPHIKVNMN